MITDLFKKNKIKIFGVGANKTGTTSLTKAMQELGYKVGVEKVAKQYLKSWAKRDFVEIIKFCKTANFFQDEPFSLPYTFIALDQAFPNSKFILTVRDTPEQWYNSVVSYMSKKYGKNGNIPTKEDLQKDHYIKKGFLWETTNLIREVDENDIYNKESVIARYNFHNESVKEYFRHRPKDLLLLNVAEKGAYKKLCDFLGKNAKHNDFPHLNKTSEINTL
jgi:hypothetical protein